MTHLRAALCGPIVFMRVSGCRRPAFFVRSGVGGGGGRCAPDVAVGKRRCRVVQLRSLAEGTLGWKREKPPGGRVVRARLLPEGALARSRAGRGRQSGVGAGGQTFTVRMSSRSVV